jgi:hypothetical protein
VTTSTLSVRYIFSALAAVTAAALLAGCAGSPLGSQGPSQVTPAVTMHSPVGIPDVKNHCTAHGGVRVTPCTVDFTPSSTGPDTVIVRTPENKKGTLSEYDNCTSGSTTIATVAQGSGDSWVVTAGATTGSCTAEFDFLSIKHNKKIGYALLSITNSI